jgi:2'-5' RNA ligase
VTETRRVFFAVWPDWVAVESLAVTALAAQKICGGRASRPETLHLTLAFLGNVAVSRLPAATAAAAGISSESFVLTLDHLGYWRHNRVLWAGGTAAPLTALAGNLVTALRDRDFQLDGRPFAPHVTLVRDARCRKLPELDATATWLVREFVLAESHLSAAGACYEIVGRWPLR